MKGQGVFITLVILMAVSSIVLIWSIVLVERLHLITQASEAIKALYAADSALDCKFYKIYIDNSEACPPILTNNTKAEINETSVGGETTFQAIGWTTTTQIYRSFETEF